MYQVLDALLMRAATHPAHADLPAVPDLTGPVQADLVRDWLTTVWSHESLADAITVASPALAGQVARIRDGRCHDPRQLRRTVVSVARYLLRATGRGTPFALFAGVTPAAVGREPAMRWGRQHEPVTRADGAWLASVVASLEQSRELLRRLPVVLNDLADVSEDRVILRCQRPTGDEDGRHDALAVVDVSVRHTAAVAAIMAYARTPIVVDDLLDKLRSDFPNAAVSAAEAAVTRLVRLGVLLTALRPPMTASDGLTYVLGKLTEVNADAVPEVAETVRELRGIAGQMRSGSSGRGQAERHALNARMQNLRPAVAQPVAVDLRLDTTVVLPPTLTRHARDAAAVLTRLTPYPRGLPAWQEYHGAFLERYGVDAVVPIREVINPDVGIGLPATYRGSDRTVAFPPLTDRDRALIRLAQTATMGGGDEVALNERTIADITGSDDSPGHPPPHVELFLQVHAGSVAALRRDRYTLVVTGAARAAGATTGRFLHLLDAADRDRFRSAYTRVATVRAGAVPAQLSFSPLRASSDHLACSPPMLPNVLPAGEYVDSGGVMRIDDLAIGGDVEGLFLISLRDRRIVEPTVFNAVEFRSFSHPLARFLCELPRARAAVYMPFSWGAAASLTFLPRVRSGRTVLAPARWNLTAADLPRADAPFRQWHDALAGWQARFRLPDRVYMVEADNLLPLNLAEHAHRELLRAHLNRQRRARLDEAPHPDAYGWLDGHAHEITIPLTATEPAGTAPSAGRTRTADHDEAHLPGAAPWLYAKLYTSPDRTIDVLTHLPDLLDGWDSPVEWWYLPYRDPDPHLRLRIRLPHPDAYGAAAARVGAWAATLRQRRLLGRLQLDTYHPETGRYGSGLAMTLAERAFASDSTAALAELRAATAVPLGALAAASLVDIAIAFLGDIPAGMQWLISHLAHEPAPGAQPLRSAAVRLADPSGDWAALRAADRTGVVLQAWQQRRIALAAYRELLATQREPLSVLSSLLHLHSIRLHGIDPDRERQDRRLARAAALRWSALHTTSTR